MEVLFWIGLVAVVVFGIYKFVTRDKGTGGSGGGGGGRGDDNSQNRH